MYPAGVVHQAGRRHRPVAVGRPHAVPDIERQAQARVRRDRRVAPERLRTTTYPHMHFMELISVDTLKTMQLIGFNYKTAIGEPLTLMLKNFLLSKVKEPDSVSMFEKVLTPELVEILKDDTAYENFRGILGGESND